MQKSLRFLHVFNSPSGCPNRPSGHSSCALLILWPHGGIYLTMSALKRESMQVAGRLAPAADGRCVSPRKTQICSKSPRKYNPACVIWVRAAPHYLTWTINLDAVRTKPRKRSPFKLEARAALIIQQISHSISCAPPIRGHALPLFQFSLICISPKTLLMLLIQFLILFRFCIVIVNKIFWWARKLGALITSVFNYDICI